MRGRRDGLKGAIGLRACVAAALAVAPAMAAWGAASDPASGQLEEIIVTAQRRAENIQRVPISVTAVTAEQLESARVDSIDNVQAISPSISFDEIGRAHV